MLLHGPASLNTWKMSADVPDPNENPQFFLRNGFMTLKTENAPGYETGSSFRTAFFFLGKERKRALSLVYAFCRIADDIADDENSENTVKRERLLEWKEEIENIYAGGNLKYGISLPLREVVFKYSLDKKPFLLFLEGMEADLLKKEYATIKELEAYMYRVASAVGLMCMPVFGIAKSEASDEYARHTGHYLQLVNIMRDIAEDAKKGRVYVPEEFLDKCGYPKKDVFSSVYNENFIELMRALDRKAGEYRGKAVKIAQALDSSKLMPSMVMIHLYERILARMGKNGYRIFESKTKLNFKDKMTAVYGAWRTICRNRIHG